MNKNNQVTAEKMILEADHLDSQGRYVEANAIDLKLKKYAQEAERAYAADLERTKQLLISKLALVGPEFNDQLYTDIQHIMEHIRGVLSRMLSIAKSEQRQRQPNRPLI